MVLHEECSRVVLYGSTHIIKVPQMSLPVFLTHCSGPPVSDCWSLLTIDWHRGDSPGVTTSGCRRELVQCITVYSKLECGVAGYLQGVFFTAPHPPNNLTKYQVLYKFELPLLKKLFLNKEIIMGL